MQVGSCRDPDCRATNCLGNRVEVEGTPFLDDKGMEIQEEERVRIYGVHHKNDTRGGQSQGTIEILLPLGPLNDLLLFWIRVGWGLIPSSSPELFRSTWGNTFSKCTFTQYWASLMRSALPLGLPYYPPNIFRTSYVDAFTQGQ
jgi:hypothetical protein